MPRALSAVQRVYRVWGQHPRFYAAQDPVTFLGRHRAIRRRVAEALRVGPGARVLEVACGSGRNFPYVEEQIGPGGELVGFDYSREMLDAAAAAVDRHGWSNVTLVEGDAAVLEVGDQPFDGVLCALGLSAMPDHLAALRRCHDVLRPGGYLAVCDARPFTGRLAVLNPLLRAVYVPTTGWHPERDLLAAIESVFGAVSFETFNGGSIFVAWARRGPA